MVAESGLSFLLSAKMPNPSRKARDGIGATKALALDFVEAARFLGGQQFRPWPFVLLTRLMLPVKLTEEVRKGLVSWQSAQLAATMYERRSS